MRIVPVAGSSEFAFVSGYSPALRNASRLIPGMHFDPALRQWQGYPDAVEATYRVLVKAGLRIDATALPKKADYGVPIIPVAERGLRDYQKEGVRFLISRGATGALLGDAMGLGKTCQALTAARALKSKTLIVVPSFSRGVWESELGKWWPDANNDAGVYFLKGTKATPELGQGWRVIVCHYDILHAWVSPLIAWGPRVLILDECHLIANSLARRTKAVAAVGAAAALRWGLSGTPQTNRTKDLHGLLEVLSPGRFGAGFFPFGLRYCEGRKVEIEGLNRTVWDFKGASNTAELHDRLDWLMLRRTQADVALQLPPKTRQVLWLDPPGRGAKDRAQITDRRALRAALDRAADRKLPAALDVVKAAMGPDVRVVVFCHRRAVADWIGAETEGRVIHGGVSQARRGKILSDLGAASSGVLACTIDSCSTSIDLSWANVGVVVELTYEPHELLQLEARLHRWGSTRPTLIQYVLGRGTVDEIVAGVVVDKLDVFEKTVGATGEALSLTAAATTDSVLDEIYKGVGATA